MGRKNPTHEWWGPEFDFARIITGTIVLILTHVPPR